ncbi:MAG: ATP synthase F1 subunit delta [Elusimicrobiota bacterium]
MEETILSQRYAHGFVNTIKTPAELISTMNECAEIKALWSSSDELNTALNHPAISITEKKALLFAVLSPAIDKRILSFLHLLITKKRINLLPLMLDKIIEYIYDRQDIKHVEIDTAAELSQAEVQQLTLALEKYFNKKVLMKINLNPTLIAGLIIKYDDNVIDNTLATQLSALHRVLVKQR